MTAALRARLEADRSNLLRTPADRPLEFAFVRMLADIQTAIAAVEAVAITKENSP